MQQSAQVKRRGKYFSIKIGQTEIILELFPQRMLFHLLISIPENFLNLKPEIVKNYCNKSKFESNPQKYLKP